MPPKLFVLGDSISIHYGPYLKQYTRGAFDYSRKSGTEEALQDLDIPQGANGGDSSMVLQYLEAIKSELKVDYLLVNCGLHDIRADIQTGQLQVSIEDYQNNLSSIVAIAKDIATQMVWVTTTAFSEEIHNTKCEKFHRFEKDNKRYMAVADKVMKNNNIPRIDLNAFTLNLGNELYENHVHFYKHVREKQGAYIAGWMEAFHLLEF